MTKCRGKRRRRDVIDQNVQDDDKGRGKGKDGHEGVGINVEND